MGAWSHEPFGNDDALDWLSELEASDDLTPIEEALDAVTEAPGAYLEAPECSAALAAAEIVATLLGKPPATLPEEVQAWVDGKPTPDSDLVAKARAGVAAILEASELQELWEESDDYEGWHALTQDLLNRLA